MKKHFNDLTKIDCPLGELDDDTAARLFVAWRNVGEVQFCDREDYGFGVTSVPSWRSATTYRIRPEPLCDIDPQWDYLPEWVQFVARDKSGSVYCYENHPLCSNEFWDGDSGYCGPLLLHDNRKGNKPWRESLVERPNK